MNDPARPLHVAVLSDREADGGANIAGYRITEALAGAGQRVTAIYERGREDARWATRLLPSGLATHTWPRAARLAARAVPRQVLVARHDHMGARALGRILSEVRPDVVLVHNLHIASWSPALIREATRHAPVVCTLHDTWTFTGRCVYPGTCVEFRTGCTAHCPTAAEYPALRPTRVPEAWRARRALLEGCTNLAAVSPSRWLADLALSGLWRSRAVFTIPYAIDLSCFEPRDRTDARNALGITGDALVVLAAASDLGDPRKGIRLLFDALRDGLDRPVHLLLLGQPTQVPALAPTVTVQPLGFIADDRMRARAYAAADVFVHPALADNAPLTVIESLACGTPVVAFPVDGLPETTLAGRTGWLATEVSSQALKAALNAAVADLRAGVHLRASCRAFAETRYEPRQVASQYDAVFRALLRGHVAPTGHAQTAPQPSPGVTPST
jgi:glycosyltransferase involved in cell wall biosynthesis